jgi:hypothetical protein
MVAWYGAIFWSYSAKGWMGFIAVQTDGRAMLRHELLFYKQTPATAAGRIHAFMKEKGIPRLVDCIAQPEIFPKTKQARGETVSETFRAHGIHMTPGDKDRVNGWARFRAWLDVRTFRDDDREVPLVYDAPSLQVHADCVYFLDTALTLVSDKNHPDDIEETTDEYPASAVRFWVMSRPLPPQKIVKTLPPGAIGHEIDAIRRGLRRA